MTGKDEDLAFELDDALLDSIARGKLTEDQEQTICKMIQMFKQHGFDKERLLGVFLRSADEQLAADAVAFIEEKWDSVTI